MMEMQFEIRWSWKVGGEGGGEEEGRATQYYIFNYREEK